MEGVNTDTPLFQRRPGIHLFRWFYPPDTTTKPDGSWIGRPTRIQPGVNTRLTRENSLQLRTPRQSLDFIPGGGTLKISVQQISGRLIRVFERCNNEHWTLSDPGRACANQHSVSVQMTYRRHFFRLS